MQPGFSTVDWESWNTVGADNQVISKITSRPRFQSKDGRLYELSYCATTDYASTPAEVWGAPLFLTKTGWWSLPSAFHDNAFQNLLLVVNADGSTQLAFPGKDTEGACNLLMMEMMQSIKPNPTLFEKAQMDAIYAGVTIGGWHAFKNDRA